MFYLFSILLSYLGLWQVVHNVPLPLVEPRHLDAGHVGPGQTGPLPAPGEDLHTLAGVGTEARVDLEVRRSLETESIAPPHNQAGTALSHLLQAGWALSARRSSETTTISPLISSLHGLHSKHKISFPLLTKILSE